MNRFQPIYDIAELCSRKGLVNAVLCPGSRCAPLTLAFARHPKIVTKTFSDERSAAFIALGLAQQAKSPSILLCTSGTAVYNFAPAVAEAYFSQTPLVIFTADRPAEWVAQNDGQTIYQSEIFGKHVKQSFQLPQEYEHADNKWAINRIVNEAINLAKQEPQGPVHINAPFREPLYPGPEEKTSFDELTRVISESKISYLPTAALKQRVLEQLPNFHNVLIVAGQNEPDEALAKEIARFTEHHQVPLIGEVISNLHSLDSTIRYADVFLSQASDSVKKTLRPDLLITFGKSVLSKNLKQFLRKYTPKAHWHIQPDGNVTDTFQTLNEIFRISAEHFFSFSDLSQLPDDFSSQKQRNYKELWEIEERRALRNLESFFPQGELGELELVREVLRNLPRQANLHLANSMSVRYGNIIGLRPDQRGIRVYANRGTSGVDGCTSTAVGHCLVDTTPNILITGDLAFFYDRNAFWHNYSLPNLRVLLLNNHGGIIFKMIDGPGTVPESDEFFVTRQKLSANYICQEYGFEHLKLDIKRKLKNLIKDFFDFDGKTKILELESDGAVNKTIFENLKLEIKKSYEV